MDLTDANRWHGLAAVARALSQSARVDTMIAVAADSILAALGADSVSLSRLDPGTWTLRTLVNAGRLGPDEQRFPQAELYQLEEFEHFKHVFRDQRTWIASVEDPDADPAEYALLKELGKGSSLTAPLLVDGVLWGELYAAWFSPVGAVEAMHDGFVDALTAVVGGAVSRALEAEALEHLAFRDPLTGLANRRALDSAAQRAFAEVNARGGRRVSVVAIDVNGLKAINDHAGHQHGDHLIRAIATQLVRNFKPLYGSLAARVGGDEFTVLVPGHAVSAVMETSNNFCLDVRALPGSSGVSCGVATQEKASGAKPTRLFSAADSAMYEAKRTHSATAVLARPVGEPVDASA
jgi:diguanylate cyclase (GGDEF)-like protein